MADIIILDENINGHDKAIGDVHGGLTTFKKWLNTIGPDDRGMCVGDLVDRGEKGGSVGVIEAIVRHNQDPTKGKIHAVLGNHEVICLKAINALLENVELLSAFCEFSDKIEDNNAPQDAAEKLLQILSTSSAVTNQILSNQSFIDTFITTTEDKNFIDNPDNFESQENFILRRMLDKISTKEIEADAFIEQFVASNDALNFAVTYYNQQWLVEKFVEELNYEIVFDQNTRAPAFSNDSQFNMIHTFLRELPYIIHVEGLRPYSICHADMKFISDQELRIRALRKMPLSEEERDHITFARKNDNGLYVSQNYAKNFGKARNRNSALTIVGHNIIDGLDSSILRANTNTVDLDVMSWHYKAILSLNITTAIPEWVGVEVHPQAAMNSELDTLDNHMVQQILLYYFIKEVSECQTLQEVEAQISEFSEEGLSSDNLREIAINFNALSEALIFNEFYSGNLKGLLEFGLDPDYTFMRSNEVYNLALLSIEQGNIDNLRILMSDMRNPHILNVYPDGISLYDAAVNSENSEIIKIVANAHLSYAIAARNSNWMAEAIEKGATDTGWNDTHYHAVDGKYNLLLTHNSSNVATIPQRIFENLVRATTDKKTNVNDLLQKFYAKHPPHDNMISVTPLQILEDLRGLSIKPKASPDAPPPGFEAAYRRESIFQQGKPTEDKGEDLSPRKK